MILASELLQKMVSKHEKGQLAHFYILRAEATSSNKKDFLTTWVKNLIAHLLSFETSLSVEKCLKGMDDGRFPDFLVIEKKSKTSYGKDYHVDDFNDFFNFLNLCHFETKHRFVLINDAHLLSEAVSNKLLKSLEAPTSRTTIFLIDWQNSSLLETLSGRAVKLLIPTNPDPSHLTKAHQIGISQYLKTALPLTDADEKLNEMLSQFLEEKITSLEFIEEIKKNEEWIEIILKFLILYETSHFSNYEQKQKILDKIKLFEDSKRYHNNLSARIYQIIELVKNFK